MFKVLWIEDQRKYVLDLAPKLSSIPGVSLKVLLFAPDGGYPIPGLIPVGDLFSHGRLSIEAAWQLVAEAYRAFTPWLVIVDLRLDTVEDVFTLPKDTAVKDDEEEVFAAQGIVLTRKLYEATQCRNVVWLTNYGEDVLDRCYSYVVDKESEPTVIAFPRTYVVSKQLADETLVTLVSRLTSGVLAEIRETNAERRIKHLQIVRLFDLLFSCADSVTHYFRYADTTEKLESRKCQLANSELLPYESPPVCFSTWLRARQREGDIYLEDVDLSNRMMFADQMSVVLSEHLWGMRVEEAFELIRVVAVSGGGKSIEMKDSNIAVASADPRVVGPIARERFICALQNAIGNAVQNTPNGGRIVLSTVRKEHAIYLLLMNSIANEEETKACIEERAINGRLHGIQLIRSAIKELNRLHPFQTKNDEFGAWGFKLLVGGKSLHQPIPEDLQTDSERNWFSAGVSMPEVKDMCSALGWGQSAVVAAFRMPLVAAEDLALRSPGTAKAVVAQSGSVSG
jgi:hypothetical protein